MLRIRHDKPLHEADTLASLEVLIAGGASLTLPPAPATP